MHRRTIATVRRTNQIVAVLKTGSPMQIHELSSAIVDDEFTIEVVQEVLANLSLERLPAVPPDVRAPKEVQNEAWRGVNSLSLIMRIALLCYRCPDSKQRLIPLVLGSLEGIICWSSVSLDLHRPNEFNGRYICISTIFTFLFLVDYRTSDYLLSSQAYINILLKLWITKGVHNGRKVVCMEWDPNPLSTFGCPLGLVDTVLLSQEAKGALVEVLLSRDLTKKFVRATMRRAKQVRYAVLSNAACAKHFHTYARGLLQVIQNVSANADMCRHLRDARYLAVLMKMLHKISAAQVSQDLACSLKEMRHHLQAILKICLEEDTAHSHSNVRDIIAGGCLEVFARMIVHGYDGNCGAEELKIALSWLDNLKGWVVDPAVCQALRKSRLNTDMKKMFHIPVVQEAWRSFWDLAFSAGRVWSTFENTLGSGALDLCDNLLCKHERNTSSVSPRQCSCCKSVVYCSSECQRVDWRAVHKKECQSAYAYNLECTGGGKYTHLSRAFQVKYLEMLYGEESASGTGSAIDSIAVFQLGGENGSVELRPADVSWRPAQNTGRDVRFNFDAFGGRCIWGCSQPTRVASRNGGGLSSPFWMTNSLPLACTAPRPEDKEESRLLLDPPNQENISPIQIQ